MTQQTKKDTQPVEATNAMREGAEKLARTAENVNKKAAEYTAMGSENIESLIESGNAVTQVFQDISKEVMDNCNRTFTLYSDIAIEAPSCRTINEMIELQTTAVRQICDNYFQTQSTLCTMLFKAWEKTMAPINERTAITSDQFRKRLAA